MTKAYGVERSMYKLKGEINMDNNEKIIKYYEQLDRSYFMETYKEYSHEDVPFPIGHEQTISQPSLVLKMTLLLDTDQDSKTLEIGTGSGYQTALLSKACKAVYTVERIEALYVKAKARLNKAGYANIEFKLGDGSTGWQEHAPYDRIMVTAAASKIPDKLIEQLAIGGKMIIPVGSESVQELMLITKDSEKIIKKEVIGMVRFVRLIGDY